MLRLVATTALTY